MSNGNNLTPLQELKNTAIWNKKNLKNNSIISNIDGSNYSLKIDGVGQQALRLVVFFTYEDILKFHHNKHLENVLYNMINKVYWG